MEGGQSNVTNTNDYSSNNQRQREWENHRKEVAEKLLDGYAIRTGFSLTNATTSQHHENNDGAIDASPHRRRYLWTDAFALANYISLINKKDVKDLQQKSVTVHQDRAMHLVEAVHETLGKHRLDHKDPQMAGTWLPNASQTHPTAGGLRIGKSQDERPPGVPYNADTEWEKDGQYFHYLTKWGTALDMITRSKSINNRSNNNSNQKCTIWAMELLQVAASKFVTHQYGRPQMYWKLSIDLSRPLVASQGARDALEGYILASRLIGTCDQYQIIFSPLLPNMFNLQRIFHSMIYISETDDPLEVGGMLLDMCQLFLLEKQMGTDDHRMTILHNLKKAVMVGLESLSLSFVVLGTATKKNELVKEEDPPSDSRTPFRELGLSLGLRAMERLVFLDDHDDDSNKSSTSEVAQPSNLSTVLLLFEEILVFLPLAEQIETFWLNLENQSSKAWTDHLDMNEIMLASSLNPSCWL